jgi:hypothetical protein
MERIVTENLPQCFSAAGADRGAVTKAVDAAWALPTLDRCAGVRLLRAVFAP